MKLFTSTAIRCWLRSAPISDKYGRSGEGKQRYKCRQPDRACQTFILGPSYRGRLPSVKQTMVDMALNGSGIRDTARVLQVSPKMVISELKKSGATRSR